MASSASSSCGRCSAARAMATRWRSPPELVGPRVCMPAQAQSGRARRRPRPGWRRVEAPGSQSAAAGQCAGQHVVARAQATTRARLAAPRPGGRAGAAAFGVPGLAPTTRPSPATARGPGQPARAATCSCPRHWGPPEATRSCRPICSEAMSSNSRGPSCRRRSRMLISNNCSRRRRDTASNAVTSAMTTSSRVASRGHWKSSPPR